MPRLQQVNMSDEDDENIDSPNNADDGADKDQDKPNGDAPANEGDADDAGDSEEIGDDDIDNIENADELKEKLKAQTKQNKKLFERTMKAEGKVLDKATGKWVKKDKPKPAEENRQDKGKGQQKTDDLSSMDTIALIGAKITTQEDIEEVRDYAKLKGITIAEALEVPLVKTMIKERADERTTANATNTGPTRRGSSQVSGDTLFDKAGKTGELPDSEEDMEKLADAQVNQLASKNKK